MPEHHIQQSVEVIDPQTAQKYLEQNTANRPLRARHVHALAADMAEGRWKFTPDPIAFRHDGVLMNGQHRLSAVLVANKNSPHPIAVPMAVSRGLQEESWAYLDRGIKRNTADEFSRNGIKNAPQVSSSTRLLWRYENNLWSNDARVSDEELFEYLNEKHPTLPQALSYGKRLAEETAMTPTSGTVCLYLSRKADLSGVGLDHEEWENQVIHGLGFSSQNAPALRLRRQLANRRTNNIKTNPKTYMALYAKAFRAWARGKEVRMFKSPQDHERVPSIENPFS